MANLFLPQIITWFRLDEHVKRLKGRVDALEANPSNPTLQQVTTAGNTSSNDIEIVQLNTPKRLTVRTYGFNDRSTGLDSSSGLFMTNNRGTTTLSLGNNTTDRVLDLPDEDGTLITDAPSDSQNYVRNNAAWVVAESGSSGEKGYANFELYTPFVTPTGTGNNLLQMLFPILLSTNHNIGSNFDQNTGRYTNNSSEPIRVLMQISLVTATSTFSLGLSNMLNVNFQSSVGAIQVTGIKPVNGAQVLVLNGSAIFYLLPGQYVTASVQYNAGASITINKIDVTITEL